MWTCPSDRREVQEHHCERREPSSEEEDQWANAGKTEYTLQHVSELLYVWGVFLTVTNSSSSSLQDNQRLKQDLMKSQTKVALLHSEMDSLKTEITDQSMNSEQ